MQPSPPESYMSAQEAREWIQLQAEICKKLVTDKVTSINQLDSGLVEATRVHLAICEVENHQPIAGLFIEDTE